MAMPEAGRARNERRITIVVAFVYLGVLALDVWLLIVLPDAPWEATAAFLFQVVGLFALATGFVSTTELSKNFSTLLDEMTSPNLRDFLYGNLKLGTVLLRLMSDLFLGLLSAKGWYGALPFSFFWLLALPLMFVVVAAFYVIVIPIAYLAYLAASVPLLTIRDAQDPFVVTAGDETVNARELVDHNMGPLRSFVVGLTATLFAFVTGGLALY
jgi:hypothetical protein